MNSTKLIQYGNGSQTVFNTPNAAGFGATVSSSLTSYVPVISSQTTSTITLATAPPVNCKLSIRYFIGEQTLENDNAEWTLDANGNSASIVGFGLGVFLMPSGDVTGVKDRAAVQEAHDEASTANGRFHITLASGQWYFNGAVTITKPIIITGMGASTGVAPLRGTLITNVSASPTRTFYVNPTTEAIWGGAICDLAINGNGVNDGIGILAGTPHTVSQSRFCDLVIRNVRDGIYATGTSSAEVYQNEFRNIKITGCTRHGFYLDVSSYNQLWNIETTGITGSLGYGFYLVGTATTATGLMTEGCVFINAPWGRIASLNIETIQATTPVSSEACRINGTGIGVYGLSLVNVNPAKCNYGIVCYSANATVRDVIVSGTQGPAYVFTPQAGSSGLLENCQTELAHFYVEQYSSMSNMAGWRFRGCDGGNGVVRGNEDNAKQLTRLFALRAANFQSTSDQTFTRHGGFTNYRITQVKAVTRSGGATVACSGGIYTAAAKSGTALVAAGQSWLGLSANGKMVDATVAGVNVTDVQTATPILSLTTGSTAAVTADVFLYGFIMDTV
jgi:hypothetical protein